MICCGELSPDPVVDLQVEETGECRAVEGVVEADLVQGGLLIQLSQRQVGQAAAECGHNAGLGGFLTADSC